MILSFKLLIFVKNIHTLQTKGFTRLTPRPCQSLSSSSTLTNSFTKSKYKSEKKSLPEQTQQKQCMWSGHNHQGASAEKPK